MPKTDHDTASATEQAVLVYINSDENEDEVVEEELEGLCEAGIVFALAREPTSSARVRPLTTRSQ